LAARCKGLCATAAVVYQVAGPLERANWGGSGRAVGVVFALCKGAKVAGVAEPHGVAAPIDALLLVAGAIIKAPGRFAGMIFACVLGAWTVLFGAALIPGLVDANAVPALLAGVVAYGVTRRGLRTGLGGRVAVGLIVWPIRAGCVVYALAFF